VIEHPSILLAGIAARASHATERHLRLLNKPPLSDLRAGPLGAHRAGASDDHSPSRSSNLPSGSAVEAGRPAKRSPASDECDCAVCSSDLAGLVPCPLEEDEK